MFYLYAYKNNVYFWHHFILAGAGNIALLIAGVFGGFAAVVILLIGLIFEVWQYLNSGWAKHSPPPDKKILSTSPLYIKWQKKIFWLDSYGDMIAALIAIILTSLLYNWIIAIV